jgi:hypothetical protein
LRIHSVVPTIKMSADFGTDPSLTGKLKGSIC